MLPTMIESGGGSLLCRVCLERGATIPIFESIDSPDPDVYSKLCQCTGVKIEDVYGYPRHICKLCHITLNTVIKFIKQFHESTEILSKCEQQVVKEEVTDFYCLQDTLCDDDDDNIFLIQFTIDNNKLKLETEDDQKANEKSMKKKLHTKKHRPKAKPTKSNTHKKKLRSKKKNIEEKPTKSIQQKSKLIEPIEPKETKKAEQTVIEKNVGASTLCDLCGMVFKNSSKLKTHRLSQHSTSGTVQCQICSKSYCSQVYLRKHKLRVHTPDEDKKFSCTTCGKRFVFFSLLDHHNKISHGAKKGTITCSSCDKKFLCKRALQMHMRSIHTGERPYVCSVCDKQFADPNYLTEHMRLHTGERPFKCLVCDKGFAQRGNLKSHIRHNHRVSQLDEETLKKLSKCKTNYLKHMLP